MNSPEQKINQPLKIETIKTPEGGEVSLCSERGGIITSLKIKGKEILYMDGETLIDPSKKIRGGIPILFPNAGPVTEDMKDKGFALLGQHGFARDLKSWLPPRIKANGFSELLISNKETREIYPYDFSLSMEVVFTDNGGVVIEQFVQNGDDKELPVSMGLHPYFKIGNNEKKDIIFDFKGGDFIKDNFEKWANGEYVSIDNPKTDMKIYIPSLGTLVLNASKEYKKIWIWSLPEKDFICVEPVMGDSGDIMKIGRGEELSTKLNINLL